MSSYFSLLRRDPPAKPTVEPRLDGFTIEHVRCMVTPEDMHTLALALISGVIPYRTPETPMDNVLDWFGRSLVPFDSGFRGTESINIKLVRRTVTGLDTRTNQVAAGFLDLLRIRHTALARAGASGGNTLCGAATLSCAPGTAEPGFSLRGTDVYAGNISATFAAANTLRPADMPASLAQALGADESARRVLTTVGQLAAGRDGESAGVKVSKAKTVATYAPDVDSIWSLTPRVSGEDMTFDVFHAEYANTPVYRVFKPAPEH